MIVIQDRHRLCEAHTVGPSVRRRLPRIPLEAHNVSVWTYVFYGKSRYQPATPVCALRVREPAHATIWSGGAWWSRELSAKRGGGGWIDHPAAGTQRQLAI